MWPPLFLGPSCQRAPMLRWSRGPGRLFRMLCVPSVTITLVPSAPPPTLPQWLAAGGVESLRLAMSSSSRSMSTVLSDSSSPSSPGVASLACFRMEGPYARGLSLGLAGLAATSLLPCYRRKESAMVCWSARLHHRLASPMSMANASCLLEALPPCIWIPRVSAFMTTL